MSGGIMDNTKMTRKLLKTLLLVRPEFRSKPHIRRWCGKWECIGHGYSSLGYSPEDAYESWHHYGALLRGSNV
jgi:hypothetical protein